MKTVAIFAHYDVRNLIKDYVIFYLQELNKIANEIIFVSTSTLPTCDVVKLSSLCIQVILRDNVGHDFYSYKVGLDSIKNLSGIESLILCNDSCFGPLFDLPTLYSRLIVQSGDFLGISTNQRPILHLQSYFLIFNHQVINSSVFAKFWSNVAVLSNKDEIVMQYEVGLSQCLLSAGFKLNSWLPLSNYKIDSIKLMRRKWQIFLSELSNPNSRYSWKSLFEPLDRVDKTISLFDFSIKQYHLPFLKKSLFKDSWIDQERVLQLIEINTEYSSELIKEVIYD